MSVADIILIVACAWLIVAVVGGFVFGRVIRNRNLQVPVTTPPLDGAPTFVGEEWCVHAGDPNSDASLRFIASGPDGRARALRYAQASGGQLAVRTVLCWEWRTESTEQEAS